VSRRLRAALFAVAGAAGLASLTACGSHTHVTTDSSGLPVNRPVKRADLVSRPEGHLRLPGSVIVQPVGMDQTPSKAGEEPNPAFTGAIFEVRATPSQLYAWYGSSLASRGFSPARYFMSADQTSGQAWQFRHRLQVQVAVFDPTLLWSDAGIAVNPTPGELVYESVLVGYPPGRPKF
jgi:hypothetical protein